MKKKLEEEYLNLFEENKKLKEENDLLKELISKNLDYFELKKYIQKNINQKPKEIIKEVAIRKKSKKQNAINTKEYKQFRQNILKRDNYKCQMCGSDFRLQVHHIKSRSKYPELIMDKNNCITLCLICHSKTDNFFKT